MKNNLLAITLPALLTFLAYSANSVESQTTDFLAQNQIPKSPQLNDRRPPIARIDPNKPIQIRVANNSRVDIQAGLTEPASDEITVNPKKYVTFGRLNKSFLPLPINLTIYTNAKETNLTAEVRVVNNEIIVTVTSKKDVFGTSLEINANKKGDIFLY